MHHLTLTPPPFPPHTHHPKSSLPLSSVRIDALQRRDRCAVALCWRAAFDCCAGGEVIPLAFIRPSFPQSSTHEWSRTLIQAHCLSSPQHRSISCWFFTLTGGEEGGRSRECVRGAGLRSGHGRWQPSLVLVSCSLFFYLFGLRSCHMIEWWLFQYWQRDRLEECFLFFPLTSWSFLLTVRSMSRLWSVLAAGVWNVNPFSSAVAVKYAFMFILCSFSI